MLSRKIFISLFLFSALTFGQDLAGEKTQSKIYADWLLAAELPSQNAEIRFYLNEIELFLGHFPESDNKEQIFFRQVELYFVLGDYTTAYYILERTTFLYPEASHINRYKTFRPVLTDSIRRFIPALSFESLRALHSESYLKNEPDFLNRYFHWISIVYALNQKKWNENLLLDISKLRARLPIRHEYQPILFLWQAQILTSQERYNEAKQTYALALQFYENTSSQFELKYQFARLLLDKMSDPVAGRQLLQELINNYPGKAGLAELQFLIGESYFSEKRWADARIEYRMQLELLPNEEFDAKSWCRLCRIYLTENDCPAAYNTAREAIDTAGIEQLGDLKNLLEEFKNYCSPSDAAKLEQFLNKKFPAR